MAGDYRIATGRSSTPHNRPTSRTSCDGGGPRWSKGRGVHRAVLAERLRLGDQRGASLALTLARIGSSSPILRRLGFEAYGRGCVLKLAINSSAG